MRERQVRQRSATRQPNQLFGKMREGYRFTPTEIKNFPFGFLARAYQQERIDNVVNVVEIAFLPPFAKQLDCVAIQGLANEPGNDALTIMTNQLARTIGVRQTQTT